MIALILFVSAVWLILLFSSMMFPPKRGAAMRVTEKVLAVVSALLLVMWVITAVAT